MNRKFWILASITFSICVWSVVWDTSSVTGSTNYIVGNDAPMAAQPCRGLGNHSLAQTVDSQIFQESELLTVGGATIIDRNGKKRSDFEIDSDLRKASEPPLSELTYLPITTIVISNHAAAEKHAEAQLLDRCASIPRDPAQQLLMLDRSRINLDRTEDDLLSAFTDCDGIPVASRDDVTTLLEQAARDGSVDAQFAAAGRYPLGSDENIRWNQIAATNGHEQAQVSLAQIYLEKGDDSGYQQAYAWLQTATSNGSVVAEYHLSKMKYELPLRTWTMLTEGSK